MNTMSSEALRINKYSSLKITYKEKIKDNRYEDKNPF